MNMMKIRTSIILFGLVFLIMSGCADIEPPSHTIAATSTEEQKNATKTPEPSPIPTNTIAFPPTPFIPTPSDEQVNELFNALQDKRCLPPCYLGITPGKTRFEEANYKLLNIGARIALHPPHYAYEDEIMYKYNYVVRHYLPEGYVSQGIGVFVYKGYVFRMDVDLGSSINGLLLKYWDKYTIPSLLAQYGIPDAVFVSPYDELSSVWLLYSKNGVFIENASLSEEKDIVCPDIQEDNSSGIDMILFAPEFNDWLVASSKLDAGINLALEVQKEGINPYIDVDIETVLGITPKQFYEQMMTDSYTCFRRVSHETP